MQFIDLEKQQQVIRQQLESHISLVLSHGKYINGPEVDKLENLLAGYTGCNFAVGCSSGTDALLLGLMAYGVATGQLVFTTPFTFIATAEVISLLGAVPVFVDIDALSFNLDARELERAVHAAESGNLNSYPFPHHGLIREGRAAGIIGVDLFGLPADYEKIDRIAEQHGLFVIEDAAQSFGAEYFGRKACSLAGIGCTSFFPAKPLGCYGDGGMCFTDKEELAEIIGSLRVHGKGDDKYDNVRIGINGRLDTLQAAILLAKFEVFEEELNMREVVANRYNELLCSHEGISLPFIPEGVKSAWAQYSIVFETPDRRNECQSRMKRAGIPTAVYYPTPLHLQTAFAGLGYKKGDFPVSESVSARIMSLPMHPYLSSADQEMIVSAMLAE